LLRGGRRLRQCSSGGKNQKDGNIAEKVHNLPLKKQREPDALLSKSWPGRFKGPIATLGCNVEQATTGT
jgi:hypothetical protein